MVTTAVEIPAGVWLFFTSFKRSNCSLPVIFAGLWPLRRAVCLLIFLCFHSLSYCGFINTSLVNCDSFPVSFILFCFVFFCLFWTTIYNVPFSVDLKLVNNPLRTSGKSLLKSQSKGSWWSFSHKLLYWKSLLQPAEVKCKEFSH